MMLLANKAKRGRHEGESKKKHKRKHDRSGDDGEMTKKRKKRRREPEDEDAPTSIPIKDLWNGGWEAEEDAADNPLRKNPTPLQCGDLLQTHAKTVKVERFLLHLLKQEGSKTDKMGARASLIRKSPLSSLHHLEAILEIAEGHVRRESAQAIQILIELFAGAEGAEEEDVFEEGLLPSDRKLIPLSERLRTSVPYHGVHERKLMLWYFEDELKKMMQRVVQALERGVADKMFFFKSDCMNHLSYLLSRKPEQEDVILRILINKLTDPEKKTAGKGLRTLLKLLENHPSMIAVVVKEIEALLWRPNVPKAAVFYAVCFLHQLKFETNPQVAGVVVGILLDLFKLHLKEPFSPRVLRTLLQAVIKVFETARPEEVRKAYEANADQLYKFVASEKLKTAVTCLRFIFRAESAGLGELSNRFYLALYALVLRPHFASGSSMPSTTLLLNLLYESLQKDPDNARRCAFGRRLLQVTMHSPTELTYSACLVLFNAKDCSEILSLKQAGTQQSRFAYNPINLNPKKCFALPALPEGEEGDEEDETPSVVLDDLPPRWELVLQRNHWHKAIARIDNAKMVDPGVFALQPFLDKWITAKPRKAQEPGGKKTLKKRQKKRRKIKVLPDLLPARSGDEKASVSSD